MNRIPSAYKPIPFHHGYYVTKTGVIRNRFRKLKPIKHRDGHFYHDVVRDGKQVKLFVHRAVMLAFGPPNTEKLPLIRHLDGKPYNNHITNLAWGSHAENAADRERHRREARCRREKKLP